MTAKRKIRERMTTLCYLALGLILGAGMFVPFLI